MNKKTRKTHSVEVIGEMLFAVEIKRRAQADVLASFPGIAATTLSGWVKKYRTDKKAVLKAALPGVP